MKRLLFKFFVLVFVIGLLVNLEGCAALKRKFTRKKKEAPVKSYFEVKEYRVFPSTELYEKHYIFWVNWHKKLIADLGKNHKSDARSIDEAISNLESMASQLTDDKAELLSVHTNELRKAKEIVAKRDVTKTHDARIRSILEREYRVIRRDFSPSKVKGFIREDFKKE